MTTSRNIALKAASGEVIAFLDDDAFAHPDWLENLLLEYQQPQVGAVGGRALNNLPNEATIGVHEIGRLKANGELTGNFGADPGQTIEVDHIIGCNMSFRRETLAELGGFREDFPGFSGIREDTDMSLRVRRLGYVILFAPRAAVLHVGAPQISGRRFDMKYVFYGTQNHCVMLRQNFGLRSSLFWRYAGTTCVSAIGDCLRRVAGLCGRAVAALAGLLVGLLRSLCMGAPTPPVRTDAAAEELKRLLSARNYSSNVSVPFRCLPETAA